jgi:hypothetical protein
MEIFFPIYPQKESLKALSIIASKNEKLSQLSLYIYILVFCLGARACFLRRKRDDENDALLFAKSLSTRICDGKLFSLHVVGGIFFFVFIGDESSSFSNKATTRDDESRKNGGISKACCSFFVVHRDCLSRGF